MTKTFLTTALAGYVLSCGTGAWGAEIEAVDLGDGLTAIAITGEITDGDGERFRREAAKYESAVVLLESDGGSTIEAIHIGEAVRLRGFGTLVLNETRCASACGLIWLAGAPRALSQSARVGFHATYEDSSGRALESGVGNALVGRYLAVLNLPTKAIIFATEAPPDRMNWLDHSNANLTGIEVSKVDDWNWKEDGRQPAHSPPPITVQRVQSNAPTSEWAKIGSWSIMVDHTLGDSCFITSVFSEGTSLRIGFDRKGGGGSYLMMANDRWGSLKEGDKHNIQLTFDAEGPWDAEVDVVRMNDVLALTAPFADNAFWAEFAASNRLVISRGERQIAYLSMKDSSGALDLFLDCQRHFNELWDGKDPFRD